MRCIKIYACLILLTPFLFSDVVKAPTLCIPGPLARQMGAESENGLYMWGWWIDISGGNISLCIQWNNSLGPVGVCTLFKKENRFLYEILMRELTGGDFQLIETVGTAETKVKYKKYLFYLDSANSIVGFGVSEEILKFEP